MRLRAAFALALAALAPAGTALAADPPAPVWHDPQAGLPATADLRAIAAAPDGTLVAVGQDSKTLAPVVYRRIDDDWTADKLTVTQGDLVAVALDGTTAWTVGYEVVGGQRKPLLLSLGSTGWSRVAAPAAMDLPRAVALTAGGGAIGDAAGHVFALADGAPSATPVAPDPNLPPPAGRPVDDLLLSAPTEGIALAGGGAADSGFVKLSGGQASKAPATPSQTGLEAVAVAATATDTLAVEGPGPCSAAATGTVRPDVWRFASPGIWQPEALALATATTRLCDVTAAGAALVIAGMRDGHAVVWRLENGTTTRVDLDAPPLRGVAAVASDDLWAVGDDGTVLRYAVPPLEPAAPPAPADDGSADGQSATVVSQQTSTEQQPSDQQAPSMQVTVTQSPAPAPVPPAAHTPRPPSTRHENTRPAPRRLLSALKVRRTGSRLVLTFRLAAPARVVVRGRRNGRVVALATSHRLPAGRVRLLVRFRGHRPPTRLSIVVRAAEPRGQSSKRS